MRDIVYMNMHMCVHILKKKRGGGETKRREREQTHFITSSFDILSLSHRKPATPNRRYREGGLEVGVVGRHGQRVLFAHCMKIGNTLHVNT